MSRIHLLCLILCIGAGCDPDGKQAPGVGESDGSVTDADLPPAARDDDPPGAGTGGQAGRGGGGAAGTAGRAAGAGGSEAGKGGSPAGGAGGGSPQAGKGGSPEAGKGGSPEAGKGGSPEAGKGGSPEAGKGGSPAAGSGGGKAGAGGAQAGRGGGPAAGSGGGKRCGTRGSMQCGAGQFCNFEPDADCGGTDRGGVCQDKPQVCTDIYLPVCGCDNRTHSSDCNAHSAGVSIRREGMCNPDECAAAGGRVLTSNGANIPECNANETGWNISGGREQVICCVKTAVAGRTCGGIAALECDPKQFCNYEEAAGGQGCDGTISDAAGVCQPIPNGACTRDYRPVCSCDRRSYSNACVAHADGASIMHEGACTENDCKARGGRVAFGPGTPAMCNANETEHGFVVGNDGSIPIEGALCCLP